MQNIKLPYGLRDGELIHISEVDRGRSCDCLCPSCNGQLVARKGEYKVDHFAHYTRRECHGALETALHLAAKKILERCQSIVLPSVKMDLGIGFPFETIVQVFPSEESDPDYEEGKYLKYGENEEWQRLLAPDPVFYYRADYICGDLCTASILLSPSRVYEIDKTVLETRIDSIIPDLIVTIQNVPLLIEIYVTHSRYAH